MFMFNKNPVRFVVASLIVLLALGLIHYVHPHNGSSNPRTPSPAHLSFGLPPAAPSKAKTGTPNPLPPKANPAHPAAPIPAQGHTSPAQAEPPAPAVPGRSPTTPVVPSNPSHVTTPPSPATGTSAANGVSTYVVQPGDTLWTLARVYLGDPYRWTELFTINQGRHEPGGVSSPTPT